MITAAFSALGDDLEQELRADFRQWHVADLVDCDKVVARPSRQYAAELQLMLGFDQFVDQRSGRGEPHSVLLPTGRYRQSSE
jgi:hypothetical protein